MKRKSLIILFIYCSAFCRAQFVTIPDANFAAYLQSIIPGAMSGNQMDTTNSLVTTTTHSLYPIGLNISNLSGVQYFSSLRVLECANNQLTTLPTLSDSLTLLICQSNFLTSLPTLPNTLTQLTCSTNQLTALPTLPNSIDYIECGYNQLTNLPSLPTSITIFSCSFNQITSLPPLPNLLKWLRCSNNLLNSLPALPNTLNALYCYNNNISCFPVFPNSIFPPNMTTDYLEIYNNPFTCLPNYISGMNAATLAYPLCASGNPNGCPVADIEQLTDELVQLVVYPNPASNSLLVTMTGGNGKIIEVRFTDILGNEVKHEILLSAQNITFDVSDLQNGIYFINVKTNEGVLSKKIIVQR